MIAYQSLSSVSAVTLRALHALQGGSELNRWGQKLQTLIVVVYGRPLLYSLHRKVSTLLENTEHKNVLSSARFLWKTQKSSHYNLLWLNPCIMRQQSTLRTPRAPCQS